MIKGFYYWMYRGLRKIRKEEDPASAALLGVLFFIGLNIIVIGRIIHNMVPFVFSKNEIVIFGIFFALLQIGLGYFFLYQKRKEIFSKMQLLNKERLRRDKIIFVVYILFSTIAFYVVTIYY